VSSRTAVVFPHRGGHIEICFARASMVCFRPPPEKVGNLRSQAALTTSISAQAGRGLVLASPDQIGPMAYFTGFPRHTFTGSRKMRAAFRCSILARSDGPR
jgi:hypothetical protein